MVADTPFANIRVTLKNENRLIQTNERIADRHEEQTPPLSGSSSPPPSPTSAVKLKDSLKKKVLLKNTLSAAAAASNASTNDSIVVTKRIDITQVPCKNETPSNGSTPDMSSENLKKSNDVEVTVLRKAEAKVNAHR